MTNGKSAATVKLNPPLKWPGGKRWLAPHLLPLWRRSTSTRLVEPFCGGLAITLAAMPREALLNDINPHLINFYRQLQRGLVIDLDLRNDECLYYRYRKRFNELIRTGQTQTKLAAEYFYYLNRTGYNGLCRFNQKGEFNVPFGRYKRINYRRDFTDYREMLSRWEFSCCDFERLSLRHGDFVYADPPYDVPFTRYSSRDFTWPDQVRLARWLAAHRGPVVLSNQATKRIIALYRSLGFDLRFLSGPRRISCTGDRTPAKEVLATRGL